MKETAATLLSTEHIGGIVALTYSHVSPKVPEIMENRAQNPSSIQNSNGSLTRASPDGKAIKALVVRCLMGISF